MTIVLTILSTIVQIIVKILYISAKATIKTAQITAKAAVKTGKTVHKAEKATRGARKKARKVVTKTAKTAVKTTKTGVSTVKNTGKAASRGVQNVSNSAKNTIDLVSGDKEKRDTALDSIKNKAGNNAKSLGKKATSLAIKSPVMALKLTLKLLKGLLTFFRFSTSFLAMITTVWSCFLILLIGCIISCVAFAVVLSDSEVTVVSASQKTPSTSSSQSSVEEADSWLVINQGDYGDVEYSKNSGDGSRGNVAGVGCGLCSLFVVSEHYSGNQNKFTIADSASEIDTKFNNQGTNLSRAVIPWWFNEAHTELGLTCSSDKNGSMNLDELDNVLSSGGCAIVCYHSDVTYNGKCVWTSGGHYVTIISGNQNDGYMVRDSNGTHESSEKSANSTSGIPDWCPYSTHVFSKEYIQPAFYYYYITKNN